MKITGEPQEDGTLFETDIYMNREAGGMRGDAFPSVSAWVADLDTETGQRAPWFRKHHKLSVEESSVVWVDSKQHYMEVRRGSQTTFAAMGRRYWLSVEEWLDYLTPAAAVPVVKVEEVPVAIPVAVAVAVPVAVAVAVPVVVISEVPVAVPVVEEVPVAIPVPVAAPVPVAVPVVNPPFNPEKFQKDFDGLIAWARNKCDQTKPAAIIQICAWLLEMKARPTVAIWLEETPLWRVSIRTIVQAREWEWTTPASAAAVASFLEKF